MNDNEPFADLWVRVFWLFVLVALAIIAGTGIWFLNLVRFLSAG